MISFLYPALWFAALAAAIPIILHLIKRRESRRLTFPAIRYLRKAERRHKRQLRLRHLLLLGTRVLLVLLLAATAAGPLIGRGGAKDHRPTALAIVLDESLSSAQISDDRRLLDLFVERARLALDLSTPDDRIALFSAVDAGAAVATQELAVMREHLANLDPSATKADLPTLLLQANAWLNAVADGRAREIHILTDLQELSLHSASQQVHDDAGAGVSALVYIPDYEPPANGAPADPIPQIAPLNAGRQTRIAIPLNWFGSDQRAETTVIRLVVEDDVVAVGEAQLGATTLLQLPPQDSGWVQGYVDIDRSGLSADDRRYFTWFARPTARVALLGDPGEFVITALEALEGGGRLRRVQPEAAEVWITAGGERLQEGLAGGRSVIVIPPAAELELSRLNARLERAGLPWRYEPAAGNRGVTRLENGVEEVPGLDGLEIRRNYQLVSDGLVGGDTSLVRLASGEPWLVRGMTTEGAAYLLLASPLTIEASALPISAAMVPFMDASVGDWARRGVFQATVLDGSSAIRLPGRARTLTLPGGASISIEGGSRFRGRRAGNYAAYDGDGVVLAFSVNAPTSEADLSRGTPADLAVILPAADWSWSHGGDSADWESSVFRSRRGKLAWRPLVALLVLIAIVETSLAAAGRRRTAQTSSEAMGASPLQERA